MTNSLKGEMPIKVDGVTYVLLMDVNALIAIEDELGVKANDLSAMLAAPMELKTLRTLFRIALQDQAPDMDDRDAGRLMTRLGGHGPTLATLVDAINASWPAAEEEPKARPPRKARRGGGTG